MVTLEVDNSYSKITNLPTGPFNKLKKLLSYSTDHQAAYFAGGGFPRTRYCIDNKGVFPTGLLQKVVIFCGEQHIKFDIKDLRVRPTTVVDHKEDFGSIQPYPFQNEAAHRLATSKRGIISAPTGSGKSLIIALIASRLRVRTLVVVPSLQIKEQLTESLKRVFKDMSNIVVENIDSRALNTYKGFDCLIIDEAHHVAAKTYQKLNKGPWAGIYYRAFLTATPFRNQTEETLLFEGIAGQVIYQLSYKDAVSQKLIVPIESYYVEVEKTESDAFTWAQVYNTLVTNNRAKNQKVANLLLTLSLSNVSTLCLVKEIKHGEILSALTGIAFANGQDENTRTYINAFNSGKIKTLIGTEGILGEGVDTKPCEYVVIAGLGKAKGAFMQKVGRCLRTYPGKETGKIILILDRSHKFLLRHYKEQVKVLKDEYNSIPSRLEIE